MGASCGKLKLRPSTSKDHRIFFVGVHVPGSDALKPLLKIGAVEKETKVNKWSMPSFELDNQEIFIWDLDHQCIGRDGQRIFIRFFLDQGAGGVIFIIDGSNEDRVGQALWILTEHVFYAKHIEDLHFLLLINREDESSTISLEKIEEDIKDHFDQDGTPKSVLVMPCNVSKEEGIIEALAVHNQRMDLIREGMKPPKFESYLLKKAPQVDLKVNDAEKKVNLTETEVVTGEGDTEKANEADDKIKANEMKDFKFEDNKNSFTVKTFFKAPFRALKSALIY